MRRVNFMSLLNVMRIHLEGMSILYGRILFSYMKINQEIKRYSTYTNIISKVQ